MVLSTTDPDIVTQEDPAVVFIIDNDGNVWLLLVLLLQSWPNFIRSLLFHSNSTLSMRPMSSFMIVTIITVITYITAIGQYCGNIIDLLIPPPRYSCYSWFSDDCLHNS